MARDDLIPPPPPIPLGRPIEPVGDREHPQGRRPPLPRRRKGGDEGEETEPRRHRSPDDGHRIDEYA